MSQTDLKNALAAGAHEYGIAVLAKKLYNLHKSLGMKGAMVWSDVASAALGISIKEDKLAQLRILAEKLELFDLELPSTDSESVDGNEDEDDEDFDAPADKVTTVVSMIDPTTQEAVPAITQGWPTRPTRKQGMIDPTTQEPVRPIEQGWPE